MRALQAAAAHTSCNLAAGGRHPGLLEEACGAAADCGTGGGALLLCQVRRVCVTRGRCHLLGSAVASNGKTTLLFHDRTQGSTSLQASVAHFQTARRSAAAALRKKLFSVIKQKTSRTCHVTAMNSGSIFCELGTHHSQKSATPHTTTAPAACSRCC